MSRGRRPSWHPGQRGNFARFALEAKTPALVRKDALGELRGRLDVSRDISTLRKQGADIPLGVVDLGAGRSRKRNGPMASA